ncbi:hypothetical protein HX089_05350 [Myroides odoratimimus]|uniref:hypothetical protein n=1 Tax=Myroides odoratimimus TaxID=76832 RepID=UPI0025785AAC|nr:hypothetical protein [Myroides odoratimimus]MDM1499084.1 hypothetical protein [Myroides odoratimimus]MDM1505390.1 hypothetical protein [Myroides odoratimimus]MDM1515817.1 hypothetical protein [Myroides odoratimimus]
MDREEFFKKNDSKFLHLGFKRIDENKDPFFFYERSILTKEAREEFLLEYDEDLEPKLLVGNTGINNGICLYTGPNFIWLAVENIEEAIEWSKKIISIEEN